MRCFYLLVGLSSSRIENRNASLNLIFDIPRPPTTSPVPSHNSGGLRRGNLNFHLTCLDSQQQQQACPHGAYFNNNRAGRNDDDTLCRLLSYQHLIKLKRPKQYQHANILHTERVIAASKQLCLAPTKRRDHNSLHKPIHNADANYTFLDSAPLAASVDYDHFNSVADSAAAHFEHAIYGVVEREHHYDRVGTVQWERRSDRHGICYNGAIYRRCGI